MSNEEKQLEIALRTDDQDEAFATMRRLRMSNAAGWYVAEVKNMLNPPPTKCKYIVARWVEN